MPLARAPPVMVMRLPFPSAPKSSAPGVEIRAVTPEDRNALADLCTDSFFGEHTFTDGPFIFLQRLQILLTVRSQLERRIGFEGDDRECRFIVAEDTETGRICGCLDMAVHLWDREERRFWLTLDEMPEIERGRFVWRPYLASVAVAKKDRRRGVARRLVREGERLARKWGHREIYLEVAQSNAPAIGFYNRVGYRTVIAWPQGQAAGGATEVTRDGFRWVVRQTDKFILKKPLLF